MDRRRFFGSSMATAASLLTAPYNLSPLTAASVSNSDVQSLLFWDLWHLDRQTRLVHKQGEAESRPEATYIEPNIGALASWPTVFRNGERWRMLYSGAWKPYSLFVAESDDGIKWQPTAQPAIEPPGGKIAPHHLYTLPSGSGGAVYRDPIAADGFPFKVFVHQQGAPIAKRAIADPTHRWHEIARKEGTKRYLNEEFMLVSRDGLRWSERRDLNWSLADWHPEPPIFGFYNRRLQKHAMTVRPGWGDRRQCLQTTSDFRNWSGPELLLQPDALDRELVELYGMPVFPYGPGYVGLLWIFHCESPEPTRGFNRFVGPLDCQLAFSSDGVRFNRSFRQPFIKTNAAGEHGGGAIEPSCLVETDDELRIYSSGSKLLHGQGRLAERLGVQQPNSILLHTLRKDGFMYLEAESEWGSFTTKPLTLADGQLTMNASANDGEVRYQLSDLESRPIEGFTFDDCRPLKSSDSTRVPLRWNDGDARSLARKIVRLQVSMRRSRLYAFHGRFHFIDAQDRWMLEDGKAIKTNSPPF